MIKNYFKIAWRSLVKDKQFTILNVLGLSAGLACSLLIFLWVNDELGFDKFFDNDNRIYKLMERSNPNDKDSYSEESSGRLSFAVKESLPEVEYAAAVAPSGWFAQNTLSANEKNIKANGQYVEPDYFNIFSFPLIDGNKNTVLTDNHSILLSDELATKLFGTTDRLIGKAIQFDHDSTFFISGIFKKIPANSSQQFDFILSFKYFATVKTWVTLWNNRGPLNYVLLKEGTDINAFNKKVANIITESNGDSTRKVFAAKFSDGYLYDQYWNRGQTAPRIKNINLFVALAIFILIIACINFMNLSTAKASRRLKEVGIKKVVGATRSQLIFQFLTESLLLTLFAMAIALAIAALLLPQFNQLTGKTMELYITWKMLTVVLGIAVVTSFLAGSYPALYISGFKPLAILKGKLNTSLAELLSRKGLVVFQFAISTILIVAVTVIYKQVHYIRNVDLGYHRDNIVTFTAEGAIQNSPAFIAELSQLPGVVNSSYTDHSIVGRRYSDGGVDWPGKTEDNNFAFEIFGVGQNFTQTMDIQMKAGRAFSPDFGTDSSNVLINETALAQMKLKNPIGTVVQFHDRNMQIVGIMKDFHYESMHEVVKPVFMYLQKGEGSIVARIKQENQQQTLTSIEKLYKKYNPNFPFTYNFLDESYQKQYENETRTASLSGYFAGLAIIISCLGLFGLAAFTVQKRQKEIGIRKVIGASASTITTMLSKDFLKLVGLALLIAFPIAWWLMNSWLQGYVYRVNITSTIFIITGVLVLIITLVAIGFQTVKAAIANPVKSLRSE